MARGESTKEKGINVLTILAPAKVNLVLEVLGKRRDGYHEICSVIQSINLCDILTFEPADEISFSCSDPSLQGEDNLVFQAAQLMKKVSGYPKGVRIRLEKRIPKGVGLGGGSSDAAATLKALNQLWELRLSLPSIVKLAARLGSDVPFFVHGGLAVVRGRGEKVMPLVALAMPWMVILVPPLPQRPDKTKYVYSHLSPRYYTRGEYTRNAVDFLAKGRGFLPFLLFNVFDDMANTVFIGLKEYRERFIEAGATNVCLVGSGPALFSLIEVEVIAKELYNRLHSQELECYLVKASLPEPVWK